MKISKQLNNNIVIASDDQGREVVLMGKGIGFGCKPGMEPNMALVEKRFFGFSSGAHTQQLAELLIVFPWSISPWESKLWSIFKRRFKSP